MPKSKYAEAFKENFNLVGLASAFTLSMALANPLPLLAGLVLEAAYMVLVPDTKWFEQRLAKRHDAEILEHRHQLKIRLLANLAPRTQERFTRLEERRRLIEADTTHEERWFRELLRKLDFLLEKFLVFADKEREFCLHLERLVREAREDSRTWRASRIREDYTHSRSGRSTPEAISPPPRTYSATEREEVMEEVQTAYDREIARLEQAAKKEQDPNTQAILEKRQEVLRRRYEFVGKIGKILANLDHQMQLVEDTFGLISDEIRARSPEQLLSDIDEVVVTSNTMTAALEEIASLEQMVARVGNGTSA